MTGMEGLLWAAYVALCALLAVGAITLYCVLVEKFNQHTKTIRMIQHGLQDVEDDLTRPPAKRSRA